MNISACILQDEYKNKVNDNLISHSEFPTSSNRANLIRYKGSNNYVDDNS